MKAIAIIQGRRHDYLHLSIVSDSGAPLILLVVIGDGNAFRTNNAFTLKSLPAFLYLEVKYLIFVCFDWL